MQRLQGWIGRKDRHPVGIDAIVHRTDGRHEAVRLSNMSNEGCRIESAGDFGIGERVQIAIPRMGRISAQVRWALPGSAGARFVSEGDF